MERSSAAAAAVTDHMTKDEGLRMLETSVPSRDTLRLAVYDYWLAKRKKLQRPLLRRLQAPTLPNDPDHYNVFR